MISASNGRLQRRHLLRGFSRLLCSVHLLEKPRAVLYIMYVVYKTVLAGCEGAEWGNHRNRLLTRDPTRYATYFPAVELIAP